MFECMYVYMHVHAYLRTCVLRTYVGMYVCIPTGVVQNALFHIMHAGETSFVITQPFVINAMNPSVLIMQLWNMLNAVK